MAPSRSRSHGRVIGLSLRLDESLPFVFVHVLGPVANRAAHLHKPRAHALESPRPDVKRDTPKRRDLDTVRVVFSWTERTLPMLHLQF